MQSWRTRRAFLIAALASASFAWAQSAPAPSVAAQDFPYSVSTTTAWTDTGLDLHSGDTLQITAQPAAAGGGCNPQGAGKAASGAKLPVPDAPPGALVVRLAAQGPALLAGSKKDFRVDAPGHLFLGVNAQGAPPCSGSFDVNVHLVPNASAPATAANAQSTSPTKTEAPPNTKQKLASAAEVWLSGQLAGTKAAPSTASNTTAPAGSNATPAQNTPAVLAVPQITVSNAPIDPALQKAIDDLPRRVNDEFHNQGDMVNFVIVGSQKQLQDALTAANWHVADTNNKEAALKAVLDTYEKKDYVQMPMSQLYLFGRVQDFGYEQAEPYAVVASRHHFRIWKAPFTYQGQTVWVGAGTHDIGFEKDQRNGKVTHKIDPAVDGERSNIGASLQKAGMTKSLQLYLPPDPVQEAKNATGGGYHSDGRILVVILK